MRLWHLLLPLVAGHLACAGGSPPEAPRKPLESTPALVIPKRCDVAGALDFDRVVCALQAALEEPTLAPTRRACAAPYLPQLVALLDNHIRLSDSIAAGRAARAPSFAAGPVAPGVAPRRSVSEEMGVGSPPPPNDASAQEKSMRADEKSLAVEERLLRENERTLGAAGPLVRLVERCLEVRIPFENRPVVKDEDTLAEELLH